MSESAVNSTAKANGTAQAVGPIGAKPGKRPKKLKVRHLSELTKRIIVERYSELMDFDEVATAMEIQGLTGKTVANVIATSMLPSRRPPSREALFTAAASQRRSA